METGKQVDALSASKWQLFFWLLMADDIDDLLDEVETKYVERKRFAADASKRHKPRLFFLSRVISYTGFGDVFCFLA